MKLKALFILVSLLAVTPLKSQQEEKPTAAGGDPKGLRAGNGFTPAQVLSKVDSSYSKLAQLARYSGTVVLQLVVDPSGTPRNIRILRSLGLGLDENAIEALTQWKFRPATKDGRPVAMRSTVEINFRIPDSNQALWRLRRAVFRPPPNGTAAILVEYTRPESRSYARPGYAKAQVELEVDEEGRVRNPRIVTDPMQPIGGSIDPAMKKDILAAAKHWRFTPAQEGGKAVSSTAIFDFIWGASSD